MSSQIFGQHDTNTSRLPDVCLVSKRPFDRLSQTYQKTRMEHAITGQRSTGHGVSFREAAWTWGRVAALSFGGPAGQIAVMHRILVVEKHWMHAAARSGSAPACHLYRLAFA